MKGFVSFMNRFHIRRFWIELDLTQIQNNYKIFKLHIHSGIMAVVKADAYGYDAI